MKILPILRDDDHQFKVLDDENNPTQGNILDFIKILLNNSRVYEGTLSVMHQGWKVMDKLVEAGKNKANEVELSEEEFKKVIEAQGIMLVKKPYPIKGSEHNGGRPVQREMSGFEALGIDCASKPWRNFFKELWELTDDGIAELKAENGKKEGKK